ncbi:hypothetical protein [Anaerophilus nitritogenes]|uniref:hypothetical protein n=1 Tax=Anaerophilus nitritogenes TaxID=2498136 RepID=UPI00101DC14F|nr:hypothetical protein [Anaerophilus nitritogenes]
MDYSEYPYTLTFSIPGARDFSGQKYLKTLKESSYIQDAYELITLDDSMIRFSLTLKQPILYTVEEYKNPGQIVLTLKPKKEENHQKIYSIRSNSYPVGESLGMLEEELFDLKEVRILKDQKGAFCIEAGYFSTLEEAQKNIDSLKEKYPNFK